MLRVVDRTNPCKPVVREPTEEEIALLASARIPIEHCYDSHELRQDGTLILRARIRMAVLRVIAPRLRAIKSMFTS